MEIFISLIIGLLAGAHTATWGMYKDAPHEGFTYRKYFRSILLSGLIAVVIQLLTSLDVTLASGIAVLFGVTYVVERAINEFNKTFLSEEDQAKYTIPMRFAVLGKVVYDRRKRWLAGVAYAVAVLAAVAGVYLLQQADLKLSGFTTVLIIGSIGGWISAFGGAWKDAPIEGFELLKFFTSPVVSLLYALMLASFTDNYLFITFGALGYTIASIETYKTFFFPDKPRGKFAGKPMPYPEMLVRRNKFVPLYAAIWLAIIVTFAIALIQPHNGLI